MNTFALVLTVSMSYWHKSLAPQDHFIIILDTPVSLDIKEDCVLISTFCFDLCFQNAKKGGKLHLQKLLVYF